MKNHLAVLSIAFFCLSCNDDSVEPTPEQSDALLTRVSRNGVTIIELHYDVERKLYRVDYYYQGNPASYVIYEYNEKGIKEIRKYETIDLEPSYRIVFTLDNFGKAIKADHHFKPQLDKSLVTVAFNYNSAGQLIARDLRAPGEPIYTRDEYGYDTDNNLIREQTTYYPGQGGEYLGSVYEYTPGDHSIPDAWRDYVLPLAAFGFDETIEDMFKIKEHLKNWSSSGELEYESTSEMSEQVFDDENKLVSQVITWKNILKPETPAVIYNMVYDYTHED